MKKLPTMKDCIDLLESKGLLYQLSGLLQKNDYRSLVCVPSGSDWVEELHKRHNKKAIYNTYIEIHYLI